MAIDKIDRLELLDLSDEQIKQSLAKVLVGDANNNLAHKINELIETVNELVDLTAQSGE